MTHRFPTRSCPVVLAASVALASASAASVRAEPPAAPAASATASAPARPRYSPFKARWTVIKSDASGGMAFDPASLERDDKTGRAFLTTLVVLAKPGSYDGKPVDFLFVSSEFDCKTAKRRDGAKVGMGPDFKPVGADEGIGPWLQVTRNTFAGEALMFACKDVAVSKPLFEGGYIDAVLSMRRARKPTN